jgi:hypothetical protein
VCCVLATEHGVRLADLWQMTRTQVREIYFRPRDEKGRLIPEPRKAKATAADRRRHVRRLQGWPEWRIDQEAAGGAH